MPEEKNNNETEVLLEDWDPEDLGNSITRLHEVMQVYPKIGEIKDALEKHIIKDLKQKKWDKYLSEESKVSVRFVKKRRQSIDKDKLKIQLPKSKIAEIVKFTDVEELEVIGPGVRDKIKKDLKVKKTEKPDRHGAK